MQSALQVRRIFRIHSVCVFVCCGGQFKQYNGKSQENKTVHQPNSECCVYCEPCYHQKSICITEKDVLYVCGILHTHKHINISNIKNIS